MARIPRPKSVARQVDHLAGVNVPPHAQCCRGIEQRHRFADAPGTGQNRELVGHWPGLDIVQDISSEPQIVWARPFRTGWYPVQATAS